MTPIPESVADFCLLSRRAHEHQALPRAQASSFVDGIAVEQGHGPGVDVETVPKASSHLAHGHFRHRKLLGVGTVADRRHPARPLEVAEGTAARSGDLGARSASLSLLHAGSSRFESR